MTHGFDLLLDESRFGRRLATTLLVSLALHVGMVLAVRAGLGSGSTPASGGETIASNAPVLKARLTTMIGEVPPEQSALVRQSTEVTSAAVASTPSAPAANRAPSIEGENRVARRNEGSGALPFDFVKAGHYYLPSRISKAPQPAAPIDFRYPMDSTIRDGTVLVRVLVNARGGVDDAIVEAADPPGIFDAVTVKALTDARFHPGVLVDRPVPVQMLLEVTYRDPGSSRLPGVSIAEKLR